MSNDTAYYSGLAFWFSVVLTLVAVGWFLLIPSEPFLVVTLSVAAVIGSVSGFIWFVARMFEPPVGQPRPQPYRAPLPKPDKQE